MSASIEPLEHRIAPAGVVAVSFKSGVLTVTGDAAANELSLAPGANFGEINLSGLDGETFTLNGQPAVGPIVLASPLLKTAVFKLNAGADELTFNGVVIPVGLDLQLGAGADDVTFTSTTIAGNLKIQGGADNDVDEVNMDGTHFRLGGSLDFVTGNGQGLMILAADSNVIGGSIRFTGGNALTQFNLGGSGETIVGGSVFVKTQANANGYFQPHGDLLQIAGDLSIDHPAQAAGQTQDYFYTDRIEIGGKLKLKYGNGGHELSLGSGDVDSLTIGGGLEVTRGLGDLSNFDIVPKALLIMGGVKATLADENNELSLGATDAGAFNIHGPVTVTGKGDISFNGGGTINGPVKITGSEFRANGGTPNGLNIAGSLSVILSTTSTSGADLFLTKVNVAGNFTVGGTAFADSLTMNDLTVNGITKISTGAGADIVRLDVSGVYAETSRLFGAVSVLTGAGDDLIQFSGPNAGETATFYSTVKIDSGTGAGDSVTTTNSLFMAGQPVIL